MLGSSRATKDVDVVAKKPLFKSFDSIVSAFKKAGFKHFEGNRTDAIRLIYVPTGVGIDLMLWELPKSSVTVDVGETPLPFYTPTHTFIRKIHCLAERKKDQDCQDILFLYKTFKDLDWAKIKSKVPAEVREQAKQQTAGNAEIQQIFREKLT